MSIIASAARTATGKGRVSNQDRLVLHEEMGFALLADGVAGRPAGGEAAESAIEAAAVQLQLALASGSCRDALTAHRLLLAAFSVAHSTLLTRSKRKQATANMAAALAGVLFVDGQVVIANLGNTRVYRRRHATLEQMTTDHVVHRPGLASLSPDEVAALRPLQVLTRALGDPRPVSPDVRVESLIPEDLFLLCSNGLSDVLEPRQLDQALAGASGLDDACERLVSAAVELGSEDDITVALVQPDHQRRPLT